ncbi:MAG: RidA family protein, partial [Rhodospirillaceae bacterium]|nr:RidA family protein [Rhodospirillaceae bacterium]
MAFSAVTPEHYPWYDYSGYSFSLGIDSGDGVYLAGHTASEYDPDSGRIQIKGDMTAQARTAYAKIGAILEAAGRSYGDAVRIVEYVRPGGIERYGEAAAVREEIFGGHHPVVNTVPVKALLRPDALIEIEVTASAGGHMEGGPAGTVFLPTIQPIDRNGDIIGAGDVAAQTEAIFETAGTMLTALGLDFSHVVKTLDYLTPAALADYRGTGAVRREFLGPVYPAAAGIIMPQLLHPDALIQYDFTAAREDPVAVNPGWGRYEKLTYSPGVLAGKKLFLSGQGAVNPDT